MDAVFAASTAPYRRFAPQNPWLVDGKEAKALKAHSAIHKYVQVCLQRLCVTFAENENYFGRRSLVPLGTGLMPLEDGSNAPVPWMTTLLSQQSDDLGSAITLSELLSNNADLMNKYADHALVKRFVDMVSAVGPWPLALGFFEAICEVNGKAVPTNQEMLLRLTWIDPAVRMATFVATRSIKRPMLQPSLKPLGKVEDPKGEMTDGRETSTKGFPPKYIGKEQLEDLGGFPPTFVQWTGSDAWVENSSDLWFSPKSMVIPTYEVNDLEIARSSVGGTVGGGSKTWVRLEDLCWVLEPERLCFAVTGKDWTTDVEPALSTDPQRKERFERHKRLALYYVSQLSLFALMCSGRSNNCIVWLSKVSRTTSTFEPHEVQSQGRCTSPQAHLFHPFLALTPVLPVRDSECHGVQRSSSEPRQSHGSQLHPHLLHRPVSAERERWKSAAARAAVDIRNRKA